MPLVGPVDGFIRVRDSVLAVSLGVVRTLRCHVGRTGTSVCAGILRFFFFSLVRKVHRRTTFKGLEILERGQVWFVLIQSNHLFIVSGLFRAEELNARSSPVVVVQWEKNVNVVTHRSLGGSRKKLVILN